MVKLLQIGQSMPSPEPTKTETKCIAGYLFALATSGRQVSIVQVFKSSGFENLLQIDCN